jgi:hypothetical protein
MTIADKILEAIRYAPLDDDVLAKRLGVSQRQSVNQTARRLQSEGRLRRYTGPDGKIVNALPEHGQSTEAAAPPISVVRSLKVPEDLVQTVVKEHLEAEGFRVATSPGRGHGIDIDARHRDGRRWVIEAKGGLGYGPQQANYFLNVLGQIVTRMGDPDARYGIALPRNQQYKRLVERLPSYARKRLGLTVFWVCSHDDGFTVEIDEP